MRSHIREIGNGGNYATEVVAYTHGATFVSAPYRGGVYSPKQNRIYLMPNFQCTALIWHYIDCNTGSVVAYTHGATVVSAGYYGGVYSLTLNRIYLIPNEECTVATWHYIDCDTGNVVAYAHGVVDTLNSQGYVGGVYSPKQDRIYLIPFIQGVGLMQYIDCTNGSVVSYSHLTIPTG